MLRKGSAGSNTAADHLQVLGGDRGASAGVPAKLMVTCVIRGRQSAVRHSR